MKPLPGNCSRRSLTGKSWDRKWRLYFAPTIASGLPWEGRRELDRIQEKLVMNTRKHRRRGGTFWYWTPPYHQECRGCCFLRWQIHWPEFLPSGMLRPWATDATGSEERDGCVSRHSAKGILVPINAGLYQACRISGTLYAGFPRDEDMAWLPGTHTTCRARLCDGIVVFDWDSTGIRNECQLADYVLLLDVFLHPLQNILIKYMLFAVWDNHPINRGGIIDIKM